jgi:hypothetical protein
MRRSDGSRSVAMAGVAWFQLAVGTAIAALWLVLLVTRQVPEIVEGRVDIWFHVVAELATAALLVTAGLALRRDHDEARVRSGVALGALGYSVVNSPGYFAEAGAWAAVGMFGLLALATVAVVRRLVRAETAGQPVAWSHSSIRANRSLRTCRRISAWAWRRRSSSERTSSGGTGTGRPSSSSDTNTR